MGMLEPRQPGPFPHPRWEAPQRCFQCVTCRALGGGSRDGTRLTHPSQWSWQGWIRPGVLTIFLFSAFPGHPEVGSTGPKTCSLDLSVPIFLASLWAACVRGKWSTGRPLEHRELVTEAWEPLVCVELTYLSRCPLSGSLEVPCVAVPGRPNGSHQRSEFMNYNWDSGFGWALGGWFLRAFSLVKNQRTRAPKFFGTDTGH